MNFGFQDAFNIAVAIVSVLFGYLISIVKTAVHDLYHNNREIADKVHALEVFVADQYVKRNEVKELAQALFKELDRIEDKLNSKQDKCK